MLWAVTVLLCLVVAPSTRVNADNLEDTEDVEGLCETSSALPQPSPGWRDDPVRESQRLLEYVHERSRRLTTPHRVTLEEEALHALGLELVGADDVEAHLSVASPLPLFGGTALIQLLGDNELVFTLAEGAQPSALRLDLYFFLAAHLSPDDDYCTRLSEDTPTPILQALPLAAALVSAEDGTVISEIETDRLREARVRLGTELSNNYIAPQPTVVVTNTVVVEGDASSADLAVLENAVQAHLTNCYLQGLSVNGRLQGAIVLTTPVGASGRFGTPDVDVDALDEGRVLSCVLAVLSQLELLREGTGEQFSSRLNIIFRLE